MSHITESEIDKKAILDELRSQENGAIVTFSGDVREPSKGRKTESINYTAYHKMAEAQLKEIEQLGSNKFEITGLRIVHRTGRLNVGETSVFIVAAARHRAPAFEACRFAIEEVKKIVPIWKKEYFRKG